MIFSLGQNNVITPGVTNQYSYKGDSFHGLYFQNDLFDPPSGILVGPEDVFVTVSIGSETILNGVPIECFGYANSYMIGCSTPKVFGPEWFGSLAFGSHPIPDNEELYISVHNANADYNLVLDVVIDVDEPDVNYNPLKYTLYKDTTFGADDVTKVWAYKPGGDIDEASDILTLEHAGQTKAFSYASSFTFTLGSDLTHTLDVLGNKTVSTCLDTDVPAPLTINGADASIQYLVQSISVQQNALSSIIARADESVL